MTLRQLGILRAKDVPPIDVVLVERPQPAVALRGQGRGRDRPRAHRRGGGGRPAGPLDGAWQATLPLTRVSAGDARHHARPGLRSPPPLLGPGPGHAGAARHADVLHRDPRPGVVAARRGPRPRPDPLVGAAGGGRGPGGGDDGHRRPPRLALRHRRQPRRDRRGLRRGGRAGGVRLRGHRPPRTRGRQAGLAENERFLRAGGRGLVGAHACFTLGDEPLDAVAGLAATWAWGSTSTSARTRSTPGRRRACAGFAGTTGCWPTPSTSRPLRGTMAHNPRSNHEQRRGLRPPGPVGGGGQPGGARHRRHRRPRCSTSSRWPTWPSGPTT